MMTMKEHIEMMEKIRRRNAKPETIKTKRKRKKMKTNISIELTDKERMNLGQKFYKKKRMITRADLNQIVKSLSTML